MNLKLDFKALLSEIGSRDADEKKRAMAGWFGSVFSMEQYTRLFPPFREHALDTLIARVQDWLQTEISDDYRLFLKCCNGGLLFTNQVFSLCSPWDIDNDLTRRNQDLWNDGMIPRDTIAVAQTNYGAYVLMKRAGGTPMCIWDPIEERELASFGSFYEWLDDVLEEARFLMKEGDLPVIYDQEEDDE